MEEHNTFKEQLDALISVMPVGTKVRYWTGVREGEGKPGRIRHPFTVLGGHTVVGWVDSHAACIAATHIELDDQQRPLTRDERMAVKEANEQIKANGDHYFDKENK